MQRQIKFRAWSEDTKEMYYDVTVVEKEFFISRFGAEGKLWRTPISHSFVPCCVSQDYEYLMQYSGLKDREGKEIYEGDIVLARLCGGGNLKLVVIYDNERCRFRFRDFLMGIDETTDEIEVIGTIYENPELLEKK